MDFYKYEKIWREKETDDATFSFLKTMPHPSGSLYRPGSLNEKRLTQVSKLAPGRIPSNVYKALFMAIPKDLYEKEVFLAYNHVVENFSSPIYDVHDLFQNTYNIIAALRHFGVQIRYTRQFDVLMLMFFLEFVNRINFKTINRKLVNEQYKIIQEDFFPNWAGLTDLLSVPPEHTVFLSGIRRQYLTDLAEIAMKAYIAQLKTPTLEKLLSDTRVEKQFLLPQQPKKMPQPQVKTT
jgi:hypothetical protein